jgi:hypothetical protein
LPFAPDRFPIYIWDLGNGIQFYGFPADDEGRVKVAFFRSKVKGEDAIRTRSVRVCRRSPPACSSDTVSCKYNAHARIIIS